MRSINSITKSIAKNTVDLYKAKGWILRASSIEYEVSKYVNNMNIDDRYMLEDYIKSLIDKKLKNDKVESKGECYEFRRQMEE